MAFEISPQICYIQDGSNSYMFDGVTKMAHNLSLKCEEEPDDKKKAEYLNNAKNEPNKVVLDATMSDVYTTESSLTNKDNPRSKSAFGVLVELKESRRTVQVITPLRTYNNMLLVGITVEQDDTIHYGWAGQLTFQEAYESTKSGGGTSRTNTAGSESPGLTPSIWYNIFGKIL